MYNLIEQLVLRNDVAKLESQLNSNIVNSINENNGYTLLYLACMKSLVTCDTIKTLLSFVSNVDMKGADNETPLYITVFNNRLDVAKVLVSKGADVNMLNGPHKETVLHLASRLGYVEMLKWLIAKGAHRNVRNARQETPLFAAAKAGRHESVYVLLQNGADASLINEDGKSPLYVASEKGYKHIVILLKATKDELQHAKAAADVELKHHPVPMLSSEEIVARAMADEEYGKKFRQRISSISEMRAENVEKAQELGKDKEKNSFIATSPENVNFSSKQMEVLPINVPHPKYFATDPLSGKINGPCKPRDEYVENETKTPTLLHFANDREKYKAPRIGGTSMVVGTGTNVGGREPIRVDSLPGETMEYYVSNTLKRENVN